MCEFCLKHGEGEKMLGQARELIPQLDGRSLNLCKLSISKHVLNV